MNLIKTVLLILAVLTLWVETTYASGQQDYEFCKQEVEKQYFEGEENPNMGLIRELMEECRFESEVEVDINEEMEEFEDFIDM